MRNRLKALLDRYQHLLGRQVLSVSEMTSRYPELCQPRAALCEMEVPKVSGINGQRADELECGLRRYSPTYIYRFSPGSTGRVDVLASGGILINRKIIPNTGVGTQSASVLASIRPSFRKSRQEAVIVAPWPHFMPMTYGDYLLFVLPRICRVVNGLTAAEKSRAVIAYPLARAPWETDYLGKLGFQPDQLIDTRMCRIQPSPQGVVCAPSGEELAWHGCGAHPADYEAARVALWPGSTPGRAPSRRLYLQRTGRRRILNEPELLDILRPHGFETIDLGAHSISDQMAMVADASLILGAHGANMISMLWSPRGATVVEFFNRGFRPNFNFQMAYNLGLDYQYLPEMPMLPNTFANLNLDVTVDIEATRKFLAQRLG